METSEKIASMLLIMESHTLPPSPGLQAPFSVIAAIAGIRELQIILRTLDTRFRGYDDFCERINHHFPEILFITTNRFFFMAHQ